MARLTPYPQSPKRPHVVERHGRRLTDPYDWLQGEEAGEIADWTAAQQAVTDAFFAAGGEELAIRRWLEAFLDRPYVFHAIDTATRRFLLEDRPGSQQPVLLARDHDGGRERVVVGPDDLAAAGASVLMQASVFPSPCGRYVAYGVRKGGGDAVRLQVKAVETGEVLAGDFPLTVLLSVSWNADGESFFYNQNQAGFIEGDDAASRPDGLYHHRVGAPSGLSDTLVRPMGWKEAHGVIPAVSDDGRLLFVRETRVVLGVDALSCCRLEGGLPAGDFIALSEPARAAFVYIGQAGARHYFETDFEARECGRIVAFDFADADHPTLVEIVPELPRPLARSSPSVRAERAAIAGGRLYATYIEGAVHQVGVFDLDGAALGRLDLPPAISVAGGGGERYGTLSPAADGRLLIDLWTFTEAPTAYVHDPATGETTPAAPGRTAPKVEGIEIEQTAYAARDGTLVPVSIVARRDVAKDGSAPCLLYAYGGGGMAITPEFGPEIAAWTALGGVYALANIRGGGERGRSWHRAAMGPRKQTSFDDFCDAAAWLVERGVATVAGLGIRGVSYGGMLVGGGVTQRPELFGAALIEIPLLDPLSAGRDHWSAQIAPEIGNPTTDPEAFASIARWSPLQNIVAGTRYPPTLTVVADEDAPLLADGARRFVATLQADTEAGPPHLLHMLRGAGHGGWSKAQQLAVTARELAFLAAVLKPGLDLPEISS